MNTNNSLTPEVSIESLQPELYAQTSVESVEGSSMEAGPGGLYGDVDLHLDGPIESTPLGQIHFSLIYDDHKKALMVKIVEACHLPLPKPPLPVLPQPTGANQVVVDPDRTSNQPESAPPPIRHHSSRQHKTESAAPHSNP